MGSQKEIKYEDFEPSSEVVQEKDSDTFVLNLPGFRKEQINIQFTTATTLSITGSGPIGDNKWRRFLKELPISPNSDERKISAKFEGGILYVNLPKLISPEEKQDSQLASPEAQTPPLKPVDDKPPKMKNVQEQDTTETDKRATKNVDGSAKTRVQKCKETAHDLAVKLKMPRGIMHVVLVVVLALVVGIYIKYCKIDSEGE